tara:strand:- start:180 stop:839 length:660 start_codon:yes stop_codon:yes gene_type:complete
VNFKLNLKQCIALITCLIITISINAQVNSEEKKLDSITLKMFKDVNALDFESIMDMTYPKVFEIASKDMLLPVYKSMFLGNDEYKITIDKNIPAYKISEVFRVDSLQLDYAFVNYKMKMQMEFLNQEFDEDTKDLMKNMMKTQGMSVSFISDNTLDVVMENSMTLFLKDNNTEQQWKMLNYTPDSPMFFQIVPTLVIEKAKEHFQNNMLEESKQKAPKK